VNHRRLPLFLLLIATSASATGPSSASADLVPVAAKDDAVLFRTRWTINSTGAHAFQPVEYGWLVATRAGKVQQVADRRFEPGAGGEQNPEEVAYERAFEEALDWKSPPKTALPLLRKYGFKAEHAVAPREGADEITWTPKQTCQGEHCWASCRQQSLHGLRSEPKTGTPVRASFVWKWLALFENDESNQENGFSIGASFSPTRPVSGWGEYGIEIAALDGLCWLPKRPPAKPDPARAIAEKAVPGATWTRSLLGDLTHDGADDVTFLGIDGKHAVVTIVAGPLSSKSAHWTLRFENDPEAADGMCAPPENAMVDFAPMWAPEDVKKPALEHPRGLRLLSGSCAGLQIYFDGREFKAWRP
jgi:hypothetical protein